ncbi:transferase domain-containing protein [Desulfonema limicola]|uniref:Transferase domain-containing protein n=1 Tax=Desulfonema limicola TaxID=45656 RepID=A0A975GGJ7_9BACT|nr:glycosyltransferase [Desulfonema limicola]QTA80411.1 transferase domain-containing protein [Desulfonema limicola]
MHFFTSITANYLPKARVLAKSVKKHNPDAIFHLVLSDNMPEGIVINEEPFDSVLFIDDLDIPNQDSWIFKHSVVELCTAVKGPAFVKLFKTTNADKIVYFDPDIAVLNNLEELEKILDKNSIVLTPHQIVPDTTKEAIIDNEICSLKHGTYNLGFLGISRSEEGLRFVQWWRDRLLEFCYDDIPNGLFTDQKWVDLAPAFFDDIFILRDKTYNVATWNLTHRNVNTDDNGKLIIEGFPVKFFHFSGFDSGAQEIMLKKYAGSNSALFKLRNWYTQELDREGQGVLGKLPSIYSFYSNGELITPAQRKLYRLRQDLMKAFPFPARVIEDKLCYYYWFRENASEEILEKERELMFKEQELDKILNSRSWKITFPLRVLSEFYRNQFINKK